MADQQSSIVIRFAVQDGQKVTEALKKLETEGTAAFRKINDGGSTSLRGMVLLQGALDDLSGRLQGFSSNAGIAGTAMARMGLGFAAVGAAVGLLIIAMKQLFAATREIAAGAEASGLSLAKYQAVIKGAIDSGASSEQAAQGLRQFAIQSRSAMMAQGDLYDQVRLINPALARQLATARDQSEALQVLVKAYDAAGSAAQRTALANAAFGEGGTKVMLGLRREAAGLVSPDRIIDPELVRRSNEVAKNINSIVDALQVRLLNSLAFIVNPLKEFLDYLNRVETIATARPSINDQTYGRTVREIATSVTGGRVDFRTDTDRDMAAQEAIDRRRRKAQEELNQVNSDLAKAQNDLDELAIRRHRAGPGAPGDPLTIAQDEARAANLRLGAQRDALQQTLKDLDAEETQLRQRFQRRQPPPEITVGGRQPIENPPADPPRDPRQIARAGLYDDQRSLQDRVAVMGEAATAADRMRLSEIGLRIARLNQVNVSETEIRLIQSINQNRIEGERIAMRTALGVATAEERLVQKRRELQNLTAMGKVSQDEATRSMAIYRKELEETVRQEQVRASRTPGLTRMRVEATRDIRADYDEAAVGVLNEMNRSLIGVARGYKDAKTAALEFGASVLEMLAQILMKRMILAPLAGGLESIVGGLAGGLGGGGAAVTASAMGNVMTPYGPLSLRRYAAGGIARSPQVSLFGEGRSAEAYVPLPDNRTIPVTLDHRNLGNYNPYAPLNPGAAAAPQVINNYSVEPPAGYEAETVRTKNESGGEDVRTVFRRLLQSELADDVKNGGAISKLLDPRRKRY